MTEPKTPEAIAANVLIAMGMRDVDNELAVSRSTSTLRSPKSSPMRMPV